MTGPKQPTGRGRSPRRKLAAISSSLAAEDNPYDAGLVLVDKYQLIHLLGEGGMGSVWLARNISLDVDVAIKVLRRDRASADAAERLQTEARATARLDHPNVVRIFDFGVTEFSDPYIVMEVLHGESLAAIIDRKERLALPNAVQTLLPVASGIVAAHAKGIIHRDLKPDNIILTTDENGQVRPKIVDFGIAKLRDVSMNGKRSTGDGVVIGSPEYMSPEQARGEGSIDARTDVWSFAIVLYETLTGCVPFEEDNYNALMRSIVEDAPLPTTDLGIDDEELWVLISRGLEKAPDDRWPDMRTFGTELAKWALRREIETDVSGNALAMHWAPPGLRRPLSDSPAADQSARLFVGDIVKGPARDHILSRASNLPLQKRPEEHSHHAVILADSKRSSSPSLSTGPTRRGQPRSWVALGFAALMAVAIAVVLLRPQPIAKAPVAAEPSRAPTPEPQPPADDTAVDRQLKAPVEPSQAAADPPVQAPNEVADDVGTCARSLFPDDTFEADADFAFLCETDDPRRGAVAVESAIVRGNTGRSTSTTTMQQWALLSWYEMAGFAIVQGRCCASSPALSLPTPIGSCARLDAALTELRNEAQAGRPLEPTLKRFRVAATCIAKQEASARLGNRGTSFSYEGAMPSGAEAAMQSLFLSPAEPISP